MNKIYHIYAKNTCLFHTLNEDEFKITWKTLNRLVGLMHTDYNLEDLSYEELHNNSEITLNSSY
jgi:hypothetical protein